MRHDFNENYDELMIRSLLITRLLDILNEARQSNMITQKEKMVYNMMLFKKNIGIFYNPKDNLKTVPKSKLSSFLKFLDLEYKDMNFRIENLSNELTNYIQSYYEKYTQTFEIELENIIGKYNINEISNKLISIYTVHNATSLLQGIYDTGREKLDFESCQNNITKLLTDPLVDITEMDLLNTKKKIFDFFIQFLTKDFESFQEQNQCIDSNLLSDINNKLDEIIQFRDYFEINHNLIDGSLLYKAHFHNLSNILFQINNDDNLVNISCVKIFASNSILIDSDYKLKTVKAKDGPKEIIYQLPDSIEKLKLELKDLKSRKLKENQIRQNRRKIDSLETSIRYQARRSNLSKEVLESILYPKEEIKALDYEKYNEHAPDLILIALNFLLTKSITIDLSCLTTISKYPYDNERAENGFYSNGNGTDGEPGLHGFSGGRLIILTENNLNTTNIQFISFGGQGGPGQNRGHGSDSEYKTEKGGDGGRAGRGGYNGFNGSFNVFSINNSAINEIKMMLSNKTITGKTGNLGIPGKPGINEIGQNKIMICYGSDYSYDEPIYIADSNSTNYKASIKESEEGYKQEEISVYKLGTEYLEFITNTGSKFKKQSIHINSFADKILNGFNIRFETNKPDTLSLLKRFQIISSYELRHLFPTLKDEILDYYKNNIINQQDKMVLDYILTTITSTLIRDKSSENPALIVDVQNFIDLTLKILLKQLDNKNNIAQQELRDAYASNYENNLKKKITEAKYLIETLQKDVEANEKEINNELAIVLKEITRLKQENKIEAKNLTEERKKLKKALEIKLMFSALKTGSNALLLLGPKGAIAAGLVQATLSMTQTLVTEKENKPRIKSVNEFVTNCQKYLNEQTSIESKKVNRELKALEKKLNKNKVKAKGGTKERIDQLPDSIEKYKLQLKHEENVYSSKKTSLKQSEKSKHTQKVNDLKSKIRSSKANNVADKATTVINTIEMVNDLVKEYNLGEEEMKALDDEIEKNSESFLTLNLMENKIDDLRKDTIRDVQDELEMLNGSSVALLDFKKWQIKIQLDDLRNSILSLINGLENKKLIKKTINRIVNAIDTMLQIYAHIEGFIQQSELFNYLAKLTSHSISIKTTIMPNEYKNLINNLENTILENVITERYEQALKAFSYWSFPLFCVYTQGIEMPSTTNNEIKSINDIILSYSKVLTKLLEIIVESKSSISTDIDNNILTYSFNKEKPFFKWSSKMYPKEIEQLLSGEIATLYADVKYSKFDALKFSTLSILIETRSSSINNYTLNSILKEFYIELTHPGVSNYKFKKNIYVINLNFGLGEKLKLVDVYGSTSSENSNLTKRKIAANQPLLSPYTWWEIKLDPIDPENKSQLFTSIHSIIQNITDPETILNLLGEGQYIKDSFNIRYNDISCIKEL